jgi:hypothetical protein
LMARVRRDITEEVLLLTRSMALDRVDDSIVAARLRTCQEMDVRRNRT